MLHRIELSANASPRELTQKVLQVMQMLTMYQAELARILGLRCADIAAMSHARQYLQPGSESAAAAERLVALYNRLQAHFDGDSVAMIHWMRAHNPELGGTPHFLLVDEGRLEAVYRHLGQAGHSLERV